MRRVTLFALWSTLLAFPLAAWAGHPADPLARPAAPARLHLYFAPSPEQLNGFRVLTFEVRLNGKAHLQETIFLETAAPEGNAFEMLASRPDLRSRLARLAANPVNRLEIQVSVDQNVIQKFPSYQSFLAYNRGLAAGGIAPRKASSLVLDHASRTNGNRTLPTKGMQVDPECSDQCYSDYQYCIDNNGCDYGDCSRCQSQYDQCIYYCPMVCVEPKSVSSSTTSQLLSGPNPTGNTGCYTDDHVFPFTSYAETVQTWQYTKVETTTHCDDTTSTSTTVWYEDIYCWQATSNDCYVQTLWSLACHY